MKIGTLKPGQHFRVGFVILMLSSVTGRMFGEEASVPKALKKAGDQTYQALIRRDMDVLLSMLSHDGAFRIAVRQAVWPRFETEVEKKALNQKSGYRFDDLSSYGWQERDMEFQTDDPDQITKLKKALVRFAGAVDNTMHGGVEVATHQKDAWDERELGPSAAGKLASNWYWYAYFRKKGNEWKIWKLELAAH